MVRVRLWTKFVLSFVIISSSLTCATLLIVRHNVQVRVREEIFSRDDRDDEGERCGIEQDRPEHRALGFEILRQTFFGSDFFEHRGIARESPPPSRQSHQQRFRQVARVFHSIMRRPAVGQMMSERTKSSRTSSRGAQRRGIPELIGMPWISVPVS